MWRWSLRCWRGLEEVLVNDVAVDDVALNTVVVDDVKLLREYVQFGSQKAFAEIVKLHMRMVYATCLREVRDANLAEDAAQSVFLTLSRKARTVLSYRSLSGWLFLAARLEGRNALRREIRRSRAEERHAILVSSQMTDGPDWFRHERVVNDALSALNTTDREAVLLRYFEGRTAREVADVLGVSETAAERRLSRAVLKMREHLATYGVASTVALIALLETEKAQAAPASAIASALQRHAAIHGAAGAHTGTVVLKGLWIKRASAVGAAVLLVASVFAVIRYRGALPSVSNYLIQKILVPEGARPVISNIDIGAPLQGHSAGMRSLVAAPHAVIRQGVLTLTVPKNPFEPPVINSTQPFEGNVPTSPAFGEHPPSLVSVRDSGMLVTGVPPSVASSEKVIWTGNISTRSAVFMIDETYHGTVLSDEKGKTLWRSLLLPASIEPTSNGMTAAVGKFQIYGIKQVQDASQKRLKTLEKQYAGKPEKSGEYAAKREAIVQETKVGISDAVERAHGALYAYQQGHLIMKVTILIDHGTVEIRMPDGHLQLVTTADIATLHYDTLKGGTLQPLSIDPHSLRPRSEVIGPILPPFAANFGTGERHLIYRSHNGTFVVKEVVTARNGNVTRAFIDFFGRPAVGHSQSDVPGGGDSPLKRILPDSLLP